MAGQTVGKMAKRYKRKARHGGGSKKLPLAIAAGVAVPVYTYALEPLLANDTARAQRQINYYAFGQPEVSGGKLQLDGPIKFYGPMIMGVLAHRFAAHMGVNRYIPKWIPVCI